MENLTACSQLFHGFHNLFGKFNRSVAPSTPADIHDIETCRLSISVSAPRPWGFGTRLAHSMATSIDFTSRIQYPPTSSLVSTNGPSITVLFSPENLMRAPFELGSSLVSSTRTPACFSS